MKLKKQKGYWDKRTERFSDGAKAKARAIHLRSHQHVAHVLVDRDSNGYTVSYSVAKWYVEELRKAGVKL